MLVGSRVDSSTPGLAPVPPGVNLTSRRLEMPASHPQPRVFGVQARWEQ